MLGFSCVCCVCCGVGLFGMFGCGFVVGLCVDYWFVCLHDLVIGGFG